MYRRKSIIYFVSIIFLLHLAGREAAAAKKKVDTRIIGGTPAHISDIPYVVQIHVDDQFICGGSLVAQRFVVSASHCFQDVTPSQVTVVGGATTLSESGIVRRVEKIMRPHNFNIQTLLNDVAVLKLAAPLTGPHIQPIALYSGVLRAGMSIKISGWGKTSETARIPSNQLRTANVPIIAKATCANEYRRIAKALTNSMFCASQPGTKDSCSGDSGGPAACDGKLCGIVSFGVGCARRNFAGVYTNVEVVKTFIENSMRQ